MTKNIAMDGELFCCCLIISLRRSALLLCSDQFQQPGLRERFDVVIKLRRIFLQRMSDLLRCLRRLRKLTEQTLSQRIGQRLDLRDLAQNERFGYDTSFRHDENYGSNRIRFIG